MKTRGFIMFLFLMFLSLRTNAQSPYQGLRVGQSAIDFSVKDHTGRTVHLKELLRNGPVILKWYRGGWCPYCNLELKGFADHYDEIKAMGASLIAITPEIADKASLTASQNEITFPIVSDMDNQLGKQYDLVYRLNKETAQSYERSFQLSNYNGNDKAEVPIPATYIIDTNGKIRYAYLNVDYKNRADIKEVLRELSEIASL